MVERIKQIMEKEELSSSQFADTVDIPRAVVSHILSGRNKPSLEVVTKIVSAFPSISIRWLMLGEGEMLKPLVGKKVVDEEDRSSGRANSPAKEYNSQAQDHTLKVQKDVAAEVPPSTPGERPKEIEQIVVFYTDKTFTAYKP